jgi:purine-binding chemotaxis protein CheW
MPRPELITAEQPLVVFRVGRFRYALPLPAVDRIVRAVEVTPLPGAPDVIAGVVNVEGRVVPVLDLRKRIGLPDRPLDPDQQFLITAGERSIVFIIDEAESVEMHPVVPSRNTPAFPELGLEHFGGVIALDGGLVLIHDGERFLSLEEARALDEAVAARK